MGSPGRVVALTQYPPTLGEIMSTPTMRTDGLERLLERVTDATERVAKASEEQLRHAEQQIRELVDRAESTSDRLVTGLRDQVAILRRDIERLTQRVGGTAKKAPAGGPSNRTTTACARRGCWKWRA